MKKTLAEHVADQHAENDKAIILGWVAKAGRIHAQVSRKLIAIEVIADRGQVLEAEFLAYHWLLDTLHVKTQAEFEDYIYSHLEDNARIARNSGGVARSEYAQFLQVFSRILMHYALEAM